MKFINARPYNKAACDAKKIDLAHSMRESALYGINCISVHNTDEWPIAFGFPHTSSLLTLEIAKGVLWDKSIVSYLCPFSLHSL